MSTAVLDLPISVALRPLPVNADEGFPQSFLLALGERTYSVELYVNTPEHLLPSQPSPRQVINVGGGVTKAGSAQNVAGLLVASIARQQADSVLVPLLRRRLLPGLVYTARELVLVVDELRVAAGNLNGAGRFGSVVRVRVGAR